MVIFLGNVGGHIILNLRCELIAVEVVIPAVFRRNQEAAQIVIREDDRTALEHGVFVIIYLGGTFVFALSTPILPLCSNVITSDGHGTSYEGTGNNRGILSIPIRVILHDVRVNV